MASVALVTCLQLPEPDPDQKLLLQALRQAGLAAELLAWDDPEGDPGAFDLCVPRSCWDYYKDPVAFMKWVTDAATRSRLLNPLEVFRWNLHKRYLQELEAAGVRTIPTAWVDRGQRADLKTIMRTHAWDDVVIKPAISASSFRTARFRLGEADAGQAFLQELGSERDVMVQKYIPIEEGAGERALVWIDGEITHAVRKNPRFDGEDEEVSEALAVSSEERDIVLRALACVKSDLLYARTDVMTDRGGEVLVSELELMEPSLFLVQSPPAMQRFVRAIAKACLQL